MKFFAVLAVLVAVAAASSDYTSWNLNELSEALQNPNTDPAQIPALENALNELMDTLFAQNPVPVDVAAPVDLTGWTLNDLSEALQNPDTDAALIPYLEDALNEMMDQIHAGIPVEAVGVPVKPVEVSYWTLEELSEAIQDPATDPALMPYLEHAINEMMDALFAGNQIEAIAVVAPAGLAPVKPEPIGLPAPSPVPIPTPVDPTPVVTPPAATSSPLVQIIVNVQQQA